MNTKRLNTNSTRRTSDSRSDRRSSPMLHSKSSIRGRNSGGVNWQFDDPAANSRNWQNTILPTPTCISPENEEHYFPSRIKSPESSEQDTDSLWTESDDDSGRKEMSSISHPESNCSTYRWIKSTTKKEFIFSHTGKRSPFLKVNMVPPSPAGEYVERSIEDLRLNLLPSWSPRNHQIRSRHGDIDTLHSGCPIDASNGYSSHLGSSRQNSTIVSEGSEFYSVSHHYEIVKHHCKELSCQTLTRKQFYQLYIKPERYLRDIWIVTQRQGNMHTTQGMAMNNTYDEKMSRLWSLLAWAHVLPFGNLSKFYWQKRKKTGDLPCFVFNKSGKKCDCSADIACHRYCLCCGSDAHGAFDCNVISVLEKVMRHYAKKCGMSMNVFETVLGFHGEVPAYVVVHRLPEKENVYLSREAPLLENTASNMIRSESEDDKGDSFARSESPSNQTDGDSSRKCITNSDALRTHVEKNIDVSPKNNLEGQCSLKVNDTMSKPSSSTDISTVEKHDRQRKAFKAPRRQTGKLTKEHTKASYEAALHRRSDRSLGFLMFTVIMVLTLYFYLYFDLSPPGEYVYGDQ